MNQSGRPINLSLSRPASQQTDERITEPNEASPVDPFAVRRFIDSAIRGSAFGRMNGIHLDCALIGFVIYSSNGPLVGRVVDSRKVRENGKL